MLLRTRIDPREGRDVHVHRRALVLVRRRDRGLAEHQDHGLVQRLDLDIVVRLRVGPEIGPPAHRVLVVLSPVFRQGNRLEASRLWEYPGPVPGRPHRGESFVRQAFSRLNAETPLELANLEVESVP